MARHNREGSGVDQRGFSYTLSYQPDWLRHVKVTRDLESGRQSTKALFRNPGKVREAEPGSRVRTAISSPEQDLEFEVALRDPGRVVRRIRVVCEVPSGKGRRTEEIEFTLDGRLPPG